MYGKKELYTATFLYGGGVAMNSDLTMIYDLLMSVILEMEQKKELFVLQPGTDFSRKRKISFQDVLLFLLTMRGGSLSTAVHDFFTYKTNITSFSPSAIQQQRAKLCPHTLPYLLMHFTHKLPQKSYSGDFQLLACDGSDINVFFDPDDRESYRPSAPSKKGSNHLHLHAMYDLASQQYTNVLIEKTIVKNESRALIRMLQQIKDHSKTIILADRGYETYHVFAHIIKKGLFFAIRTKDILRKGGITYGFRLPNKELDMDMEFFITRSTVLSKKDPIRYKRLTPRSEFDFLDLEKDGKQAVFPMKLRLVRFLLESGEYECILTNLERDEFPPWRIKELYHLRWGIETSFRKLKYNIGLSCLHSKKAEYVEQEIYAKIIMYNFCQAITAHVTVRQKDTKYKYQVNFTMAAYICHKALLQKNFSAFPPDIETLMLQYLVPVKPCRKFLRTKKRKGFVSFSYRVS